MCSPWCSFSLSSHPQIKAELAPRQKWMNLSGRGHKSFVRERVRSKVKGSPWSESAFVCSCCGHWWRDEAEAARAGLYSMSDHYRCSALKFCPVFVYILLQTCIHTHARGSCADMMGGCPHGGVSSSCNQDDMSELQLLSLHLASCYCKCYRSPWPEPSQDTYCLNTSRNQQCILHKQILPQLQGSGGMSGWRRNFTLLMSWTLSYAAVINKWGS